MMLPHAAAGNMWATSGKDHAGAPAHSSSISSAVKAIRARSQGSQCCGGHLRTQPRLTRLTGVLKRREKGTMQAMPFVDACPGCSTTKKLGFPLALPAGSHGVRRVTFLPRGCTIERMHSTAIGFR
eukprot:1159945-Pelagomonas_calceolata.AAC.12